MMYRNQPVVPSTMITLATFLSLVAAGSTLACDPGDDPIEEADASAEELLFAPAYDHVQTREALPPRASTNFYQPIMNGGVKLDHNGTYQNGRFRTLFLDNQDGGVKAQAAGYAGSPCDSWDAVSGSKYEGIQCGAHPGVDIVVNSNTKVYAIAPGTIHKQVTGCSVGVSTCGGGFGNQVVLKISAKSGDNPVTLYAVYGHLSSVGVNPVTNMTWAENDSVPAASVLGLSGNTGNSTGPHLHFQIDKDIAGKSHPMWITAADLSNVNTRDDSGKLRGYFYSALSAIGFGSAF